MPSLTTCLQINSFLGAQSGTDGRTPILFPDGLYSFFFFCFLQPSFSSPHVGGRSTRSFTPLPIRPFGKSKILREVQLSFSFPGIIARGPALNCGNACKAGRSVEACCAVRSTSSRKPVFHLKKSTRRRTENSYPGGLSARLNYRKSTAARTPAVLGFPSQENLFKHESNVSFIAPPKVIMGR